MLREISVGYEPEEDRIHLLLRCREADVDQVHRLQLTRRIALPLRDGLRSLVERSAQVPQAVPATTRQALVAGHHQARLQQTTMHAERREPPTQGPDGPRLVLKAMCGTRRDGAETVIRFEFRQGPPLTIALGERTLHALAAGLEDRMRHAAWTPEAALPLARQTSSPNPPPGLH